MKTSSGNSEDCPQDSCSHTVSEKVQLETAGGGARHQDRQLVSQTPGQTLTSGSTKRDFFGEAFMVNAWIITVDRPKVFHKILPLLIPKKIVRQSLTNAFGTLDPEHPEREHNFVPTLPETGKSTEILKTDPFLGQVCVT